MEIDRKDALKAGALLLGVFLISGVGQNIESTPPPLASQGDVKFESSQLGTVINLRGIFYRKVKLEDMFDLPYGRARMPIPFYYVSPEKPGKFDWEVTDRAMDLAVKAGKIIELQIGAKTVGWPEVNVPDWFLDEFKYLRRDPPLDKQPKSIAIDQDPKAQEIILEYADKAAQRYLNGRWGENVRSIFVENEALSENLDVAGYRYISYDFYEKEVEVVRGHDRFNRPLVQNPPFDTPKAILYVLRNSDIVGFNYYNQIGEGRLTKLAKWYGVRATAATARAMGKRVRITEYQGEKWQNYAFTWENFFGGLRNIKEGLEPDEGVYIWGSERTLATRNKDQIKNLYSLAA